MQKLYLEFFPFKKIFEDGPISYIPKSVPKQIIILFIFIFLFYDLINYDMIYDLCKNSK